MLFWYLLKQTHRSRQWKDNETRQNYYYYASSRSKGTHSSGLPYLLVALFTDIHIDHEHYLLNSRSEQYTGSQKSRWKGCVRVKIQVLEWTSLLQLGAYGWVYSWRQSYFVECYSFDFSIVNIPMHATIAQGRYHGYGTFFGRNRYSAFFRVENVGESHDHNPLAVFSAV